MPLVLRTQFGFWIATACLLVVFPPNVPAADPVYETDVRPVLLQKCGKCHGEKGAKGGLDLSTMTGILRGGESGESVVADTRDESLLWVMIDGGGMPPEDQPQLTPLEKDLVGRWLQVGAPSAEGKALKVTSDDVLPFLYARCIVCHGRRKQEGKLDLRTVDSILRGGTTGPAITPGDPQNCLLLKRVHAKEMPPPREMIRVGVRPLEPAEIETITQWIAQGASVSEATGETNNSRPVSSISEEDRSFWAFQTPVKPTVPTVDRKSDGKGAADVSADIDAFLLRKLHERHLTFSPEASRLTLIRRVAYDLTGLPPDWNDVERFLSIKTDDWYEQLVDFYLESPHYGEQWARYWLDVAGYADSEGKRSADPIRLHAWRYRDYVIRALNSDKPYDRFLQEQIAGDELYNFREADVITPEMMDALVATGFLRMAPDGTGSDIVDTVEERFEVVADEMEILGSAVLGLTLRCAQCHSHKYDPIPQQDYYRLVAVLQGAYDVYDWLKPTSVAGQSDSNDSVRRFLDQVTPDILAKWEAARDAAREQAAPVEKQLAERRQSLREKHLDTQLAELPPSLHDDLKRMLRTPKSERDDVQKYLASKFEDQLTLSDAALSRKDKDVAALEKKIKTIESEIPPKPQIGALWDRGEPSPTWVFRRGQFNNPGERVGPGALSVLTSEETPFQVDPQPHSTGRRLALARWLTDPQHPLTARVMVNRIWFHHFGRGIVESLGNFGRAGTKPTHPELLDYLAVSFVENGWSLKWLHRQLLLTEAYRQDSAQRDEHLELDPDNRWLSRMPMRRLRAESVRDSLLVLAGRLDTQPSGPPDGVQVRGDGLVTSQPSDRGYRRTIFVQQRRKEIPTVLEVFDLPQMSPNCIERPNSTVAPQALFLQNNGLVRELAASFAERVLAESETRAGRIDVAFRWAYGRPATPEELDQSLAAVEGLAGRWIVDLKDAPQAEGEAGQQNLGDDATLRQAAEKRAFENFCHVLMNSASFLFID